MSENFSDVCHFVDLVPNEIKLMIFEYVSVPDLLNLCAVCKSFNIFVGESHDFMQKIWIKFYTFKLKDLECLTKSSRNYEKLKINRVSKNEHFEYLTELQQPWRKILIYNCEFKSIKLYINLIESFCESVEELEISDIEILNNEGEIGPMKFPNLKRILFRNVPSTAIEVFLGQNKKLENVSFDISQINEILEKRTVDEILDEMLRNSEKLNHLQLGPHYMKSFFDRENAVMDFKFKVAKLFLRFPLVRVDSEVMVSNVVNFLSNQMKVEWILFFELSNDEVFYIAWNNLPLVSHVSIIGLDDLFDDNMDLVVEPNPNITHLDLICRKILISQLRKLLTAAPCLETLHFQMLNKFVLEFIVRNHHIIKEIRYENIEEDVLETYDELMASSSPDVNKSIKLMKSSFWWDKSNPFSLDPTFWHN